VAEGIGYFLLAAGLSLFIGVASLVWGGDGWGLFP
jgi:hypothetical protein